MNGRGAMWVGPPGALSIELGVAERMLVYGKRIAVLALVLALFVSVACSGGDDDGGDAGGATGDRSENLFANPGFEEGAEPWFGLHGPETTFTISDEEARTGGHSALLRMRDGPNDTGTGPTNSKVYYLVQDLTPAEFPEYLEGYYRVENWQRGTPVQYLQVVVMAWEPSNNPIASTNYQIRYMIAGYNSPPFEIGNAHFKFLSREDPVIGEWTKFSSNIREDFEELWGAAPEDFEFIRVLFEVRWDHKQAGSGAPEADVYYDDLYLGDKP